MEAKEKLYLLRDLSTEDYDSLISQVDLARKGFEFYFIIDADIFGNYCFPQGIIPEETRTERRQKFNSEYLSDEQLTLHAIFYLNETHKNILLLDEYFFEVEAMLYKARRVGAENIRKLIPDLPVFSANIKNTDFKELLYDSFSQMYAKVLFHVNGLTKAHNLLKDKKILLDSDEIEKPFVKEIIDENRGTEKDIQIIENVMLFELNKFIKFGNKSLFSSRKRDAIIVDRLLSFNRSICQNKTNSNKAVFILLSDSTLLKDTLNHLKSNNVGLEYPLISGQEVLFYRNIPQVFALLISLSYNEDKTIDFNKTIASIKELQKSSQSLDQKIIDASNELNININDLLKSELYANYNDLRNAFENAGLLKSFDQLYLSIKKDLRDHSLKDIAAIFTKFQRDSGTLVNTVISDQIRFLASLRKAGEFNTAFVYSINKIKQGMPFDLSKGADHIEGNYQHLPLLLTFNSARLKYLESLSELVRLVLCHKSENGNNLLSQFEKMIKEMNSSNIYNKDETEINLIKSLLFMILPSKLIVNTSIKENDLLAEKWLDDLKINDDNESQRNLLYLKIWCKRRINNYKESEEIATKAIISFPDDPRFYHGLFLSQFCLFEELMDKNTTEGLSLIDKMLDNLKKANNLYPGFIKNYYQEKSISLLILEAMNDSFYNSYSYCLTLKADYLKEHDNTVECSNLISEALSVFDRLKSDNGKFRDELSEYYDTEAFILYHKAFFMQKAIDGITILDQAKKIIQRAQQLSKNISLIEKYQSREKLINDRLDVLRSSAI